MHEIESRADDKANTGQYLDFAQQKKIMIRQRKNSLNIKIIYTFINNVKTDIYWFIRGFIYLLLFQYPVNK